MQSLNEEEYLGILQVASIEIEDFKHGINMCNWKDYGFIGSKYTWRNGRTMD